MTIGKKIIGGYLIVLAILIIVCAATFYTFRTIEGCLCRVSRFKYPGHSHRHRAQTGGERPDCSVSRRMIYAEEQNRLINDTRESHRQFDALVEKLRTLSRSETTRRILQGIEEIQKGHKAGQEQVIALLQQGKRQEAIRSKYQGSASVRRLG